MSTKILFSAVVSSLLFFVSFSASAQARTQADMWQRLDQQFAKPSLCDSIENNKSYKFQRSSCSSFGCDEWTYEAATTCGTNTQGVQEAQIDMIKQGKVFSRQKFTETEWRNVNGNFMRSFAASVGSYGMQFELSEVTEVDGGALRASYTVKNPKSGSVTETGYWMIGNGPFLQQVFERQQQRMGLMRETNTDRLL